MTSMEDVLKFMFHSRETINADESTDGNQSDILLSFLQDFWVLHDNGSLNTDQKLTDKHHRMMETPCLSSPHIITCKTTRCMSVSPKGFKPQICKTMTMYSSPLLKIEKEKLAAN